MIFDTETKESWEEALEDFKNIAFPTFKKFGIDDIGMAFLIFKSNQCLNKLYDIDDRLEGKKIL